MNTDNLSSPQAQHYTPAPYGGFWRRVVALIIDNIIIFIPVSFCTVLGIIWLANQSEHSPQALAYLLMVAFLLPIFIFALRLLFTFFYFTLLESGKRQSSWGQRILGLKVIDSQGQRISFARALVRSLFKMISYIIPFLGFIMIPFTNRKRALHDMIANTYVVDASFRQGDPLPQTPSHPGWLVLCVLLLLSAFAGLITWNMDKFKAYQTEQAIETETQMNNMLLDDKNWY